MQPRDQRANHVRWLPQGQTWVRMVVIGQSFMLHQIRKLVGMAVAVFRGVAPPACLRLALRVCTTYGTLLWQEERQKTSHHI